MKHPMINRLFSVISLSALLGCAAHSTTIETPSIPLPNPANIVRADLPDTYKEIIVDRWSFGVPKDYINITKSNIHNGEFTQVFVSPIKPGILVAFHMADVKGTSLIGSPLSELQNLTSSEIVAAKKNGAELVITYDLSIHNLSSNFLMFKMPVSSLHQEETRMELMIVMGEDHQAGELIIIGPGSTMVDQKNDIAQITNSIRQLNSKK